MESGNAGASSKGVLVPVSESSRVFQNNILAPLKSAYLYEESKQSFRYESAVLVKNSALEEKYNAFRAKRKEAGYSDEDLQESFGFLLFDDVNKANALGETGVLTGNSICTTLGDPSNGVYISMYSDCLDLNRWYHGKSGYIAMIRMTKGKVKRVLENYTQNFTALTVGFDCHVSEQLPSVSANTSSFLAFERTQYYMYELLDDGSNAAAQSPSAACPFAIVSFSYTDTKATLAAPQEKGEEKRLVCHYFPWRGQLQVGTQLYDVKLRSTAGALIPAKMPPVVKIDRAISMFDLRQLLPGAVFETCFSGEVSLDGLYCSLFELFSSEAEETNSLSSLLQEIKEKDLALTIQLNDGGFLILLHSSNFLTYDDTGSNATEVLQGMFVFPVTKVIQRAIKFGQRKPTMSPEILRVLPVLSYAEGEVEKTPIDPGEELCEVLAQHMQSYAALINPGLALSPSKEVSVFPDQYDVPDAHKHLYSSPEWTEWAWQTFRSYLSKPVSFQLPVSKASEILAAGQEERIEDLDDDVYICPSSPEEAPANPVSMEVDYPLTGPRSPVNVETLLGSCITSAETQLESAVPQNVVPDDLQVGNATKDTPKSGLTVLNKSDDMGERNVLIPPTSDDLPAELIVSITSAEQTVTDESLNLISTVSTTKHNDFQLSDFSTAKLHVAGVNSLNVETVLDFPEVTNLTKTKARKLCSGHATGQKKVETLVEDGNSKSQKEVQAEESSDRPQLSIPLKIDRRIVRRRKCTFRKSSKNEKVSSASFGLAIAEEKNTETGQKSVGSSILMELEAFTLRKKTERSDLKPVISECGRILVPHGSVDIADQIKSFKNTFQSAKDDQCHEKMFVDNSVNVHDIDMEQDSSTASETLVDKTDLTTSKDEGDHLQNAAVSNVSPEHSILKLSDDGNSSLTSNRENSEHSLRTDGTATPPSEAVTEKHTDTPSAGKIAKKGEFLLSKLKSVLLRGKRKMDLLESEQTTADTSQDTEPCLKKGKVGSDTGMLKSNYVITSVQETNARAEEVSKMLSVDPLFAYALGLTPKETPDNMQKCEGQDTQLSEHSSDTQEQTLLDKQPQIIQKPSSIFPRRGRIKMLKKHQDIPAECVKKKWWLHFQTPACYASENLKYKDCTRDNSVRKTVKEKMNSACSSTDALNLLADLALSASIDQVPPQLDPAFQRKPEPSLKKCDLTKDVTGAEQESVLHALLRKPAARPTQPLESPSPPSHLVGCSEVVGLVSKEHAYSLPPSSSLLLGLPGTPFQVSPLSGSTRLLHHHQAMYGDGIKILQPNVSQEDRSEQDHRTPEYLKKNMMRRRKFRHCRAFVDKNGSIQVTKRWKENYDFNQDSKFTSDSKDKAIVRALHGPWDFSMQDTSDEVRLIVHMWIGLFYSRSTARFFHVDSNQCSEQSDSLEMSSETGSSPAQSELKANSFTPFPNETDTSELSISKALDLSKKHDSVLDNGSVILDLSLRNSNAGIIPSDPEVTRKQISVSGDPKEPIETLNTLKSSVGLQEASKIQCYKKMAHYTQMSDAEIINEVNDVRRSYENMRKNAGSLQRTDVPSCKVDGTFIPVQKEMGSAPIQPEHKQTTSGTGHVLHGCNNRKTFIKDGNENSEAIERLVEKHGRDSSKSVTDEEISSNKEADDVSHTVEHDEIECKDAKNWEVEEKPYQGGDAEPSPKVIQTEDYSANGSKLSDIVCNGIHLENEKLLSREEPIALSPDNAENFNEDVDICTVQKGQAIQEEDSFGKQNALDETDTCISPVEADSNLNAQPVPMMCDGPDSGKKNYIIECDPKPPLGEQPPEVDKEEDASHDLQLRKLCANDSALTDEHAISEKTPHIPSEMEAVPTQPAVEEHSEKDICLAEKAHYQTAALPMSVGKSGSLAGSYANGPLLKTNDSVETRSQNKEMANYKLSCNDLEDENSRSIWGEQKVDNATEKEDFHHQSHPIQCEAQVVLTEETDLKQNEKTNERLEEVYCGVIIPLIGIDGEDTAQPHDFYSQVKVEAAGQEEIPFTSETTDSKKTELSAGKISIPLLDVSETNELVVSGNESDDRCPTPTMDEKPYEYLTCSGPSNNSASAFSGNETFKNMKCLHTSINDEVPHKSKVNDIEKRTLRVLQSIDVFLSESSHTDTSSQIKTADLKHSLDQTPNPRSKYIPTCSAPSHTSSDFEDIEISNTMPAVVSVSATQDLHIEPTSHFLTSPFKSKLEEVLGVKLQLSKTDLVHQHNFEKTDKLQETSVGQDWSHSCRSIPPTDSFEAIKPNIDQDRHKTTSQTNLSQEPHSFSQRPVMAVKPSKSDESQADCISKDRQIENAVMSHFPINKQTKPPVVTYTTPTTRLLEKKTESLKGTSEGLNDDMQNGRELSSRSSWLSKVDDSKSNTGKAKLVLLDQHQVRDISKFNKIPSSSLPMQSCESAKSSSKLVDGNQGFMPYDLVEKVGQTTTESIEMDQKDCSDPSTSYADYKDGGIIDECLFLGPQSSLVCTINNTSQNRSYSILDQVSQRCLQDDPTEASMEQECLIFSDQMKQLLKKSKRGSIRQQDTHGKISLSCPGPVTVHFGSLEEQEDVEDHLNSHLDAVSLVGQKIKVDMPERKDVADTAEEEKTLHPQELSRGTGNPMEHAEVSGMISEEARLYEEMMNDVCAIRKVPSRPQHFRMDRGYPRIEQSNHFDFCDQMKREMDDCFRSNLNSVVKKSCKTKYGFYILVTSDDPFFVETKAQLEAEGHTAVQPSEFFLDEDSYSSLIIVLRNEDIAEHICEVPHLLELKKSPRVQFAGIDEPDDVVNLTHQELLTRGGFIMFDRAALEPLSICNIKKMSEVLQELSKTGKWKWILHYRDSRRMKENARLSADAKEKKNYLNWCQEAGILEVLPYHECDLMSRDQPDYLTCLVRLQVQNILSRYPVFITATATNSSFGKKGILAMTFDSFLTYSPDKKCTA